MLSVCTVLTKLFNCKKDPSSNNLCLKINIQRSYSNNLNVHTVQQESLHLLQIFSGKLLLNKLFYRF